MHKVKYWIIVASNINICESQSFAIGYLFKSIVWCTPIKEMEAVLIIQEPLSLASW